MILDTDFKYVRFHMNGWWTSKIQDQEQMKELVKSNKGMVEN